MSAFTFAIPPNFLRSWLCRLHWLQAALALVITLTAAMPALAGQVGLAWDASVDPTVAGYYVYYGQAARNYTSKIDVGNQTADTVPSLTNGQTYFFTVTAYNAAHVESGFSNEVSTTIPTAPAQTVLAVSPNPSGFGANVAMTATVSGTAPSGNVTFTDGATTIAGCSAVPLAGSGNTRTAVCNSSSLGVGTHGIVARYNGDTGNGASSSTALSETITAGSSSTTVVSSANPATIGTSVTFTATVTGVAPTGIVTFADGATTIAGCSAVSLGGSGNARTAVCNSSSLGAGTHSIVARYNGDAGNGASSSTALSETITAGSSSTAVVSSANPATIGTSVTFTATVTGVAPTGNVTFTDGAMMIAGCSAVSLGGSGNVRTAVCNSSSLGAGTHSIVARYNGDASDGASSSSPVSEVITVGSSSTTVVSSANPATIAASVTFTATVTGVAPTGTVSFTDAGAAISACSAVALGGTGSTRTAVCATNMLSVGPHSVVAAYGGDASNGASSSAILLETINLANNSVVLVSSLNPAKVGTNLNLTATVTGTAPTGNVSFSDGGTPITGCDAVPLAGVGNSRVATCSAVKLAIGTHNIAAAYGGDSANTASISSALAQVITSPSSTPRKHQGLWWVTGGAESGWGVNLAHQGNQVFATWYTYDTNGNPYWLSMLASPASPGGDTYSGDIFTDVGPSFANFTGGATATKVGSGSLSFSDPDNGSFNYSVTAGGANNLQQTKPITRFVLKSNSAQPVCSDTDASNLADAANYQDLWWNPDESGWGVNFAHQDNLLFATWYTYGTNNAPLWLSALLTRQGASNVFSGTIYLTYGPRLDSYVAPATTEQVGVATVTFTNGVKASFSVTTTGAGGLPATHSTKVITRFLFSPQGGTVCNQ